MSQEMRGGQIARPFLLIHDEAVPRVSMRPAAPVVVVPPRVAPSAFGPIGKGGPWTINPYWLGETVFVVASGPSILKTDFDLIKGRKIICVNSSYEVVPFASMIYFGDGRWWNEHKDALGRFPGHVVTCSGLVKSPNVLRIHRTKPESVATGFHVGRDGVASQRTSLQGAMNLAAHLNTNDKIKGKIVLLGADMARDPVSGATHGHKPHKWPARPGNVTWDEQLRHLKWIVPHLTKRGIEVTNCSVASRITWWPKMPLEEFLAKEQGKENDNDCVS